jgi:hypothetical protein
MRTSRKTIYTLVVVLTTITGYPGVSPGTVQAAQPPPAWSKVTGNNWQDNRGDFLTLKLYKRGTVWFLGGTFEGPYGPVSLLQGKIIAQQTFQFIVNGVRYDGTLVLKVTEYDGAKATAMKGHFYLDGLPRISWGWSRP